MMGVSAAVHDGFVVVCLSFPLLMMKFLDITYCLIWFLMFVIL